MTIKILTNITTSLNRLRCLNITVAVIFQLPASGISPFALYSEDPC